MAAAQLGAVRRVLDRARGDAPGGDGELLTRYRSGRDPDAFGSLVRRHGPMVLGVCRRVLRDAHAADDAFQATFLVLARKAGAVRPPDRLAPWLYGVAYRTALKARGRAYRRRQVEADYAAEAANRTGVPAGDAADLLPALDEQVSALPEKYRDPLVLCGVQGLNKAQAAARLGLPEGTVSSRLARAREMLRDRLTRRGFAVPAAALAAALTADTLRAAVPPALAGSAAATAAGSAPAAVLTLSHEVLRSMALLNLKVFGAVALSVSLAGGGFGLVALNADDRKPAAGKPAGDKPAAKPEKPGDKPVKPAPEGDKPKPAAPDGEKPEAAKRPAGKYAGKVVAVDEQANTVTLAFKSDGGPVEKVVKLGPNAKVFVDGKEAKLSAVPKDATASVVTAGGKDGVPSEVAEVRVTGANASGLVSKVDASGVTLDVGGREDGTGGKVFKTTADTKVTVGGKEAKVADLKPGDKVTVTLTAKGDAVLAVAAGKPDGGEKPAAGEKPAGGKGRFSGKVASVDPAARTVTVAGKGEGGKEVVVRLTGDAKITIDGKDAKVADIPKGVTATFTLFAARDGQPREVSEVTVEMLTFSGVVKLVDTTSVTVGSEKTDRVVKLAPNGKVVLAGGKAGTLDDLKTGDQVTVTLTADESAAAVIAVGPAKRAGGDKPKPEKEDE